ncbi:putative holin-like toxin [Caldifermentibacillus hisashii]
MTTFQALTLIIAFGCLIVSVISLINKK